MHLAATATHGRGQLIDHLLLVLPILQDDDVEGLVPQAGLGVIHLLPMSSTWWLAGKGLAGKGLAGNRNGLVVSLTLSLALDVVALHRLVDPLIAVGTHVLTGYMDLLLAADRTNRTVTAHSTWGVLLTR